MRSPRSAISALRWALASKLALPALAFAVSAGAAQARAQELVTNDGFENGVGTLAIGWTDVPGSVYNISGRYAENPQAGTTQASFTFPISGTYSFFQGQTGPGDQYVYQTVTIPVGVTSATLRFSYSVNIQGTTNNDFERVDLVAPANVGTAASTLLNAFLAQNMTAARSGTVTVSILALAGQTVDFRAYESAQTSFGFFALDDVSLIVTTVIPTLALNPNLVALDQIQNQRAVADGLTNAFNNANLGTITAPNGNVGAIVTALNTTNPAAIPAVLDSLPG